MQAQEDVADDSRRDGDGDELLPSRRNGQEPRQRCASDVVHHQEKLARGRDHVDDRGDVRMTDAACHPRLVCEHGQHLAVRGTVRAHPLDGDRPREPRRSHEASQIDCRHPPARKRVEEGVTVDHLGCLLSHPGFR
jgi:hypothetical protein